MAADPGDSARRLILESLSFVNSKGKEKRLMFPKQLLQDFRKSTGAVGSVFFSSISFSSPWVTPALETILKAVPGGGLALLASFRLAESSKE